MRNPDRGDALAVLESYFLNWDKWESWGGAFDLLDEGRVTLEDVVLAAGRAGITAEVTAMRRSQFVALRAW